MELEQIAKQVDWLDDERRKDKLKIGSVEERLAAVEGNVLPLANQIRDLGSDITRLAAFVARFDAIDESILQARIDSKQQFESLDKQVKKREEESEKLRRSEIRAVETSINDMRKELEQLPEIKRTLKLRIDEKAD
jgi:chromosome segregation ATPase